MATQSELTSAPKRRWYHNIADAYRVTKRTYPWVTWALIAIPIVLLLVAVGVCVATGVGVISAIGWVVVALTAGLFFDTMLLTQLLTRATYAQMDGVTGAVSWVLQQIKRGWSVESEPVAMNKKQDLVWRLVGRPGIVLISEGPHHRARQMLAEESRKCARVAHSVPVHTIEVGNDEDQVKLKDVTKELRRLPKAISKDEIPLVAKRLESLKMRTQQMPHGIDPTRAKINRRMFRGN